MAGKATQPLRMPTPDEMRARFHRLNVEIDDIRAKAKPHRDAYEAKRAELEQKEQRELKPLEAMMREAEVQLHDLQQEQAMLSRALGGRVGEPQ